MRCEHTIYQEGCRRCWLNRNDSRYSQLWRNQLNNVKNQICTNLGEFSEEFTQCKTCRGNVQVKVFPCKIHGKCTLKKVEGIQCCVSCSDFSIGDSMNKFKCSDAKESMTVDEMMELISNAPPGPWPENWVAWDNVHNAHIQLLDKFIQLIPEYPKDRYSGRGIVSAVSAKPGVSSGKHLPNGYFPGAWVMARELRRHGCTLPITFTHLGPLEWDYNLTRIVQELDINVIDLLEYNKIDPMRILAGWEAKVYSIICAPYKEVLYLDADNIPIHDPSFLFDSKQFKYWGSIFWPDVPPYDRPEWLPEIVWKSVGLEYRDEVDFESGQFLIDMEKCWREVNVTRWLNEHSDRYFKIVFGDKSTFHLAWAKLGTNWAIPQRGPTGNQGSLFQHDFENRVIFQHCTRNKANLSGYPSPGHLINRDICQKHLIELREKWEGKLWYTDNPLPEDKATIDSIIGKFFIYKRLGKDERIIRFVDDGRIGKGMARLEVVWSVMGDYLVIGDVDYRPTCILKKEGDLWKGKWLEYERCEVELVPIN